METNRQKVVVDTSVLMEGVSFDKLINEYHVIIPYAVVEELDKLKEIKDKSYRSRRAIRFIENNIDDFEFVNINNISTSNDNNIIATAKHCDCALATNDLNMKLKCRSLEIPIVEIENEVDDYKGYKVIEIDTRSHNDNELLADIYEGCSGNLWDLYINQYLIIKDKNDNKTIDVFRWCGEKLIKLRLPPIKIAKPLNVFQRCALDLLHNKNIPIKFIIGEIGSGKTYLATKLGFYYTLDKGLYNKILCLRNPIGSGEKIGALPGDKIDKVGEFYTPIQQNANILSLDKLIDYGQLEFNVPFYIKGNTYDDTWIIVDESEDFDIKTLRLVGGRVGKNSCITFCGDYLQAEHKFEYNNGLKYAVNKLKDNPLVGIIFLEQNVRSDASNVFLQL